MVQPWPLVQPAADPSAELLLDALHVEVTPDATTPEAVRWLDDDGGGPTGPVITDLPGATLSVDEQATATLGTVLLLAGTVEDDVTVAGRIAVFRNQAGTIDADVQLSATLGQILLSSGTIDADVQLAARLSLQTTSAGTVEDAVELIGTLDLIAALRGGISVDAEISAGRPMPLTSMAPGTLDLGVELSARLANAMGGLAATDLDLIDIELAALLGVGPEIPYRDPASILRTGLPGQDDFALLPNDDNYVVVDIGFDISFGGVTTNLVRVHNNGYINLAASTDAVGMEDFSLYTPYSLTYQDGTWYEGDSHWPLPTIAPYYVDVDTRNDPLDLSYVAYGQSILNGSKVFVVTWYEVGVFSKDYRTRSTFQLVLYEVPAGFGVEFNYDAITWDNLRWEDTPARMGLAYPGTPYVWDYDNEANNPHARSEGAFDYGENPDLFYPQVTFYEYVTSGSWDRMLDHTATGLYRNSNVGAPGRFQWNVPSLQDWTTTVRTRLNFDW